MSILSPSHLRWVAYALMILSALPFGLSIPQFLKSRRAPYYILRERALRRAKTWVMVGLAVFCLGLIVLILAPRLAHPPSSTVPTPTGPAVITLTPSAAPSSSATPPPSATPTPRPTAIPSPTSESPLPTVPPSGLPTPPSSPLPAGPDAEIEFTALAMEKDASGLPVNPGSEFPPGQHAVYVFFTYEGMRNGVERTFAWYKDDDFFERCSQTALWEWGDRGRTSYFCEPSSGWEPGSYEVRVFVEDVLQFVAEFEITES